MKARKPTAKSEPVSTPIDRTHKIPFDPAKAYPRLRKLIKPWPKAALFQLHDEGHTSVFEILTACIISIRTFDEQTIPISHRLFAQARTPAQVAKLTPAQIDALITPSTFHGPKSRSIHAIAKLAVERGWKDLPADLDTLTDLPGVGPKCAGLALGIAAGQPHIAVDIHVHRVTHRWGYVPPSANTPEKTMLALQARLPKSKWTELNALLVPFGKHHCTARLPKCSTCPLLEMCQQIGVTAHR